MKSGISIAIAALALVACAENTLTAPRNGSDVALTAAAADRAPGAVYTLTNQVSGNAVAIFHRAPDGTLTSAGTEATGGLGTGAGLSSQGAVVLSDDNRHLLAVNAGSDDISLFAVTEDGLSLVQRVASGGVRPVSIAIRHGIVYVLNAGGSGNIAGFTLAASGRLSPIAGSARALSSSNAGAAQISFAPDGRALVVTERFTNTITVYALDANGIAGLPQVNASSGATPFGFDFTRQGTLVVSEAFGGATDASAASSYIVRDGHLSLVTSSLGTTETAACWVVVSKNGKFAYTANAGSSSITGYAVGSAGALTLLDVDGVTASTGAGAGALDLAVSSNGRFLYVLTNRANAVAGFRIGADGGLERLTVGAGLPAGAVGLAAR
jgi:6-phosphogluconolactonase (cycloisomerase 2 family)